MRIEILLAILVMAGATFFTRFASPALLAGKELPAWAERLLKHVPTAMFTALIVPALVAPQGDIMLTWRNHYLLAGLAAAGVAYAQDRPGVTMAAGMAVMFALRTL